MKLKNSKDNRIASLDANEEVLSLYFNFFIFKKEFIILKKKFFFFSIYLFFLKLKLYNFI